MKLIKSVNWKKWFSIAMFIACAAGLLYAQLQVFMITWEKKYQPNIVVTQLFEEAGCTVFRFVDGGTDHHFVKCKCGAEVKWSNGQTGLVACTKVADPATDVRVKEQPKLVLPAPPAPTAPVKSK